ncbi:hypothetical protein [Burkholderia pseudomallei]|uniref:hypothetical protein n=1 Tax=Burkholderia pseudomallei TaxID=28450 RepID=UPI0005107855|nr:hypothetical protein [Burkholderia pseudomallei]KGC51206.1 hypothetical protein DO73_5853 [Burkholderia pseudomallei]KGD28147.1 hypothetical protein DP42_5911 [Burkholderia pseudomallei]
MPITVDELVQKVKSHRCYSHPVFLNWAKVDPEPKVVGALFHQIQHFCASTRPGWNFPRALAEHGLQKQSELMTEIVDSESGHGPELATMAGYIVNRAAGGAVIPDLYDQAAVEGALKRYSDELLGSLPGYDDETGLTTQVCRAINVFERRKLVDVESTYRNLGTALALEMISNRQLIPGEKHCLVDSGLYGASLEVPEMHYLLEHWGEVGAEQQHEENARAAVKPALESEHAALVIEGAQEFLDALASVWDLLDASLLESGYVKKAA